MELQNSSLENDKKALILPFPSEFIEKTLRALPKRAQEVIKRRFGLETGEKETLEQVGRSFKITRERARQIEKSTIKKIQEDNASDVSAFDEFFLNLINEDGGVAEQDFFIRQAADFFAKNYQAKDVVKEKRNIILILFISKKIKRKQTGENLKDIFYVDGAALKAAQDLISAAARILKTENRAISENELYAKINLEFLNNKSSSDLPDSGKEGSFDAFSPQNSVNNLGQKNITSAVFGSYIRSASELGENYFGQWGMNRWPVISPKNTRDKAYLALFCQKKPMHFKEIAELIAGIWGDKKKPVMAETVHNELIKDKRFVLAGRGVYALSEWGYEKGTVRDIIIKIMTASDVPMSREEIVEKISAKRLVKHGTVVLNLKDEKTFEKTAEGNYKLKVKSS